MRLDGRFFIAMALMQAALIAYMLGQVGNLNDSITWATRPIQLIGGLMLALLNFRKIERGVFFSNSQLVTYFIYAVGILAIVYPEI